MLWRKFKNNKLYIKHHDWAENVRKYKCIIYREIEITSRKKKCTNTLYEMMQKKNKT